MIKIKGGNGRLIGRMNIKKYNTLVQVACFQNQAGSSFCRICASSRVIEAMLVYMYGQNNLEESIDRYVRSANDGIWEIDFKGSLETNLPKIEVLVAVSIYPSYTAPSLPQARAA